jgi:hypothetical protein
MKNLGDMKNCFFKIYINFIKSWIYYGRHNPVLPALRKDFVGIGQVPDVEDVINKVFHYPGKTAFRPRVLSERTWSLISYTIWRYFKLAFEWCNFHGNMWRNELLTVEIQQVFHYPGNDSIPGSWDGVQVWMTKPRDTPAIRCVAIAKWHRIALPLHLFYATAQLKMPSDPPISRTHLLSSFLT